jgi:hypothetical protein
MNEPSDNSIKIELPDLKREFVLRLLRSSSSGRISFVANLSLFEL